MYPQLKELYVHDANLAGQFDEFKALWTSPDPDIVSRKCLPSHESIINFAPEYSRKISQLSLLALPLQHYGTPPAEYAPRCIHELYELLFEIQVPEDVVLRVEDRFVILQKLFTKETSTLKILNWLHGDIQSILTAGHDHCTMQAIRRYCEHHQLPCREASPHPGEEKLLQIIKKYRQLKRRSPAQYSVLLRDPSSTILFNRLKRVSDVVHNDHLHPNAIVMNARLLLKVAAETRIDLLNVKRSPSLNSF
jgi:hypothetical protein